MKKILHRSTDGSELYGHQSCELNCELWTTVERSSNGSLFHVCYSTVMTVNCVWNNHRRRFIERNSKFVCSIVVDLMQLEES
jgi:hypothetical protein